MNKKERYKLIVDYFSKNSKGVETELHYENPFQLLVAVVLSAQCTDKRINMVTPPLFAAYPTAFAMAEATQDEIYNYIKSVSYPNSKAAHLLSMARELADRFNGIVPDNFEDLTSLPGVGRKTANVVLSVAFGKATLAVDTHVYRVSRRIGLVPESCNTPEKVEKELLKNLPVEVINASHHWLLLHGRYICKSRRPECEKCGLTAACNFFRSKGKSTPKSTTDKNS